MHRRQLGLLLLLVILSGCGTSEPKATLSVTCDGSIALEGARSVDVLGDPINGRVTLTFPDPANVGQTGTLQVPQHGRCRIALSNGSTS